MEKADGRQKRKRGTMSKSAKIVTAVLIVVITAVVGVYAYMANKAETRRQESVMTQAERVLARDLSLDYPATPKEVLKYYTEIEKCLYASDTTDEELEALGMKARELYDEELLEKNVLPGYLSALKEDVETFKKSGRVITGIAVSPSVNVDTFEEDGYEFARLSCGYNVVHNYVTSQVGIVYLLRRDENRLWKIYGWTNVENVEIH